MSDPETREEIGHYAQGIRQALTLPDDRLSAEVRGEARAALKKASARMGMGEDHTVVAFAGSTGSGKSSLFNAVSGLELAQVGVRRPTTSKPTACVWGEGGQDLLDWLQVPAGNRTWRESALDGDDETALHGLILLDLPDHDSTAVAHRDESDRLVGMVDVLVWVVDPQKYADFALHSRYLSQLREQGGSMVVVLNQIDRLSEEDRGIAETHLRSLLANDGLEHTDVYLASAKTRQGVPELRSVLTGKVNAQRAASVRLAADLRGVAKRIQAELGEPVADPDSLPGASRLVTAMGEAAGVEALGQTVRDDYLRRSYQVTGYPPLAWAQRGKADPLGARHGSSREALIKAAVPATSPAQSARVGLAAHEVVSEAVAGLPAAWRVAVGSAERTTADEITRTLDDAVSEVRIDTARPGWWSAARFFQLVFLVLTAVGILGVLFAAVFAVLGTAVPAVLLFGSPAVLVVAIVGSIVTSAVAKGARARGADTAARKVREDLGQAITRVAAASYLKPVVEILRLHKQSYDGLR